MFGMDWRNNIKRWRQLDPARQRQIRLSNIPRKVARSMAFAGEPVDQAMLERELVRLIVASQKSK